MNLNYQTRVAQWVRACFGPVIAADKPTRGGRFLEEALELVQAGGMTKKQAHELLDYVYARPIGEVPQEVGGVMVTLAALCEAYDISMVGCAEQELERILDPAVMDKVRRKQATKPKFSLLPGVAS